MTLEQDLRKLERGLSNLAKAPIAGDIATVLADAWIERARAQVGVDTGQLRGRTRVVSVTGTPSRAVALLEADAPYAGFHEYGTSTTPPNRFWRDGRMRAEDGARRLGGPVGSDIRRVLVSGGVWNPRAGWTA